LDGPIWWRPFGARSSQKTYSYICIVMLKEG
jgi:hypothetical protein